MKDKNQYYERTISGYIKYDIKSDDDIRGRGDYDCRWYSYSD